MESQKPRELLSACSHVHIHVLPHAWEFSFTAPLWGRKSLPPLQKWDVRRWCCSAGDPQEVCGKAEEEYDLPFSSLCLLLAPPSFLQAVSGLDNRQSQSGFTPLSCLSKLKTGSNCTELLPSSEITLPRAGYKTDKAQLQSSELNLLYRLESTSLCLAFLLSRSRKYNKNYKHKIKVNEQKLLLLITNISANHTADYL